MIKIKEKMNIIAIDPGVTTGVAIRFNDGKFSTCVCETPQQIWELVAGLPWNAVVFEFFATSGKISSYGLQTVEIVGGIRAICFIRKLSAFAQPAWKRKPYLVEAKKLLVGKKHMEHELDALAHLLAFEDNDATSKNIRDIAKHFGPASSSIRQLEKPGS